MLACSQPAFVLEGTAALSRAQARPPAGRYGMEMRLRSRPCALSHCSL